MSSTDHYRKYQVYFFLYLAVICELLIVIVERDDAEAELLREQMTLKNKNEMIIKELLKNQPVVSAASDNSLEVGESRSFTVGVKGLGEKDNVTVPPVVYVFRGENADVSDTLNAFQKVYPEALPTQTIGMRLYSFDWQGNSSGFYTFRVSAGTNRIDFLGMEENEPTVKIGSLNFASKEIDEVIRKDKDLQDMLRNKGFDVDNALAKGTSLVDGFISQSKNLDPASFTLEVFSNPPTDQLRVFTPNVVTAVNFPYTAKLHVEGSIPSKVNKFTASEGIITKDSVLHWAYTATEAGTKVVKVEATDNRGGGPLSKSVSSFKITSKMPVLGGADATPYAGEVFIRDIKVDGLETNNNYAWSLKLDGSEVHSGIGAVVKWKVPENAIGKELMISATYDGDTYPLYLDDDKAFAKAGWAKSNFKYKVGVPPTRITEETWKANGEYVLTNLFSFVVYTCGRCTYENRKVVKDPIRIEVYDENGRDLLDGFTPIPLLDMNGGQIGTRNEFYLKGRLPKDVTDATISIQI